jgi:hypothetical protein
MGENQAGKHPVSAGVIESTGAGEVKTGRPTTYTLELGDLICALMAEGKSLRSICELEGMPHKSTVLLWVVKGDRGEEPYVVFSDQYRRAREAQGEGALDEVNEIADDSSLDYIFRKKDDESGESAEAIVNHEHINRSRLRIETRFRFAAKMHPRKYGEKVTTALEGTLGIKHGLDDSARAIIESKLAGIASRIAAQGDYGQPDTETTS